MSWIRPYKIEDENALIEIMRLNIPQYFHETEIKSFIKYLENNIEYYWVIEHNGIIVGGGGAKKIDATTVQIIWDMINPNYANQGFGTALLTHKRNYFKQKGYKNIRIKTFQNAYKFYVKNGFENKEYIKDYWALGFDLYVLIYCIK